MNPLPAAPNLVVTVVGAPLTANEASTITVTWEVANLGDAPATGPWIDRVLLSTDAVIGADIALADADGPAVLAPGATYTRTRQVTLPQGVAGATYLIVAADAAGQVGEGNESDNALRNLDATAISPQFPDLVIENIQVPASAGEGTPFPVTYRLRNAGVAPAYVANAVERFALSRNDVIGDGDDLPAGDAPPLYVGGISTLAAGAWIDRTVLVSPPPGQSGPFRVVVRADGYNAVFENQAEGNNTAISAASVTLSASYPDLVVDAVTPATTTPGVGEQVSIAYSVRNAGSVAASNATASPYWFTLRAYFSTDAVLDAADRWLGEFWQPPDVSTIAPGGVATGSVLATLPTDLVGPGYLLIAADAYDAVYEGPSGNGNNAGASGPITVRGPDLMVSAITPPASAGAGSVLTIAYAITNQGPVAGNVASNRERIFLSSNAVAGDADDVPLGWSDYFYVSGVYTLAPGQTVVRTATLNLPPGELGARYVVIQTDTDNAVAEGQAGEGNNLAVSGATVQLEAQYADLVVDAVTVEPANPAVNQWATARVTIRNAGTVPALTNSFDRVFFSADDQFDESDVVAAQTYGRPPEAVPLAPGASYQVALSVYVPDGYEQLHLIAQADYSDAVYEGPAGEANNVLASAAITVAAPDLVTDQVVLVGPANNGQPATVSYRTRNLGTAAADLSYTLDRVFVSRNAIAGDGDDVAVGVGAYGYADGVGELPAGASVTRTARITLPRDDAGPFYVVIRTDADNAAPEGPAGEANNLAASATAYPIAADTPNLVVDSVTVSPDPVSLTGPITVRAVFRNAGTIAVEPASADRLYFSIDGTLTGGYQLAASTARPDGPVAPGGTYEQAWTVSVPGALGTNLFAIVQTDSDQQVYEGVAGEADNLAARAFTVRRPDLAAEDLTIPAAVASGAPLTVQYTVRNVGQAEASAAFAYDAVILSPNAVIGDGDDVLIGYSPSYYQSGPATIAPGAALARSAAVTVPAYLVGSYYVGVVVDQPNAAGDDAGARANNVIVSATPLSVALPADLVVEAVAAPATASLGQSIELSWTVRNAGAGATPAGWTDRVLLSLDQTASGDDLELGQVATAGALGAGASVARSGTFTIPPSAAGAFYVLVQADSAGDVFESNEANNQGASAQPITVLRPDLRPAALAGPSGAAAGEAITVTYRLDNLGAGDALGAWTDRVVLSGNAVYGDGDDVPLGVRPVAGPISAGAGRDETAEFTVPTGLAAGPYTLLLRSDATNALPESNEGNNIAVGTVLTIGAANLTIASVTVGPEATPGLPLTVTVTTRNAGTRPVSAGWSERLVLSGDATLGNADDVDLGTFGESGPLAAGEELVRARVVSLPASLAVGTYRVLVGTDSGGTVAESDEADNVGMTAAFAVSLPDVRVAGLTAPSTGAIGRTVTLAWTDENAGDRPVPAGLLDRVVLSADGVLGNGDDRVLAEVAAAAPIAVGGSLQRSAEVVVPLDAALGASTLFVASDATNALRELDEGNNTSSASFGVGAPDLAGLDLVVPAEAAIGAGTPVRWRVSNLGSEPAAARVDRVVLSVNTVLGDGDDVTASELPAGALAAGASESRELAVVIPGGLGSAGLHVFVRIDAGGQAIERELGNNTLGPAAVSPEGPDLVIDAVAAPTSARSGTGFALPVTVRNQGSRAVEVASAVRVALSAEATGGAVVGTGVLPAGLAAGASAVVAVPVSLPVNYADGGPRFLVATADAAGVVTERIETNNTLAAGFELRPTPSVDLLPVAVSTPAGAEDGASVSFSFTIRNQGEGEASGAWSDRVYLSRVPGLDDSSVLLRTLPGFGALGAGAAYTRTDAAVVPGGLSGTFYLVVQTDAFGTVPEPVGEGNNLRASGAFEISQPQRPDLAVAQITTSPARYIGQPLSFGYVARNRGPGTVNAAWTDRAYFGPDLGGAAADLTGLSPVGTFARQGQLAPGGEYANSGALTLPAVAGRYRLTVRGDDNGPGAVPPASFVDDDRSNNARTEVIDVIAPEYAATAETAFTRGPSGSVVSFTGTATRLADGQPAGNVDVDLVVLVRQARRVIRATTDGAGVFAVQFATLPTEGGGYRFFAKHPFAADPEAQGQFIVDGFSLSESQRLVRVVPGSPVSGVLRVTNAGDVAIPGLSASVSGGAEGVDVVVSGPSEVPASGFAEFAWTVTANNDSVSTGQAVVTVAAGTAAPRGFVLGIAAGPLAPRLEADPLPLQAAAVRNQSSTVEVTIKNTGGRATGPLTVSLPAIPWLFLASPAPMPSIPADGQAKVVLNMLPGATVELGRYAGSVAIAGASVAASVPFTIDVVSTGRGDLRIRGTDEFTYFGAGQPPVAGASVQVRDAVTGLTVASGVTDGAGVLLLPGLIEGRYNIEASAGGHGVFRAQILVPAGRTTDLEAFLPRQFVDYAWSVVPTSFEDRYEISLETTFSTQVPAPVVTVEPALIDLREIPDEGLQVNFTIRNHGLAAADDVHLDIDAEGVEVLPLVREIGTLPANAQVVIPVVYRRTDARAGAPISLTCMRVKVQIVSAFVCGERRQYRLPVFYRIPNCVDLTSPIFAVSGPGSGPIGPPPPPPPPGGNPPSPGAIPGFTPEDLVAVLNGWAASAIPYLQVPQWLQAVNCCLTRNNCIRAVAGCLPNKFLGKAIEWVVIEDERPEPELNPYVKKVRDQAAKQAKKAINKNKKTKKLYSRAVCACEVARECIVACVAPDTAALIPCSADELATAVFAAGQSLYNQFAPGVGLPPALRDGPGSADDLALTYFKTQRGRLHAALAPAAWLFGSLDWVQVDEDELEPLENWLDALNLAGLPESEQGETISPTERAALLAALPVPPAPLTPAHLARFIDRWNRTYEYEAMGILRLSDVPAGMSTDFIPADELTFAVIVADGSARQVMAEGYEYLGDIVDAAQAALQAERSSSGQGICSQVRLRIDQQLALTREGFNATLVLNNRGTTDPLTDVDVSIAIHDEQGHDAGSLFVIRPPVAAGFTGAPGALTLATQTEGTLGWLIIPTRDAAPTASRRYIVSGSMRYNAGGQQVVVPLYGAPIDVVPNPSLDLKYFLEREVFSDDPFTPGIEPAVPFSLGLIVANNGAGTARDVRLTSAQPEIIDNTRGLLIDFRIIGTELNANPRTPSLTLDFADLGPGQRAVAQFVMSASLQGRFTTYQARFENLNGLDRPGQSIIDSVNIFPTVHVVQADEPGDDALPDFLTDQTPDPTFTPDHVHLSSGPVVAVTPVRTFDTAVDTITRQARLALASVPGGYHYVRLNDPFGGTLRLVEVRRADGKTVLLGRNAWQTSKINRDGTGGVAAGTPERYVHLFDSGGPGVYTLVFSSATPTAPLSALRLARDHGPAGEQTIPVADDGQTVEPRAGGLSRLLVRFAEPVDPATFGSANVTVRGARFPAGAAVDTGASALSVTLRDGGLTGVIDFTPPLPDRARYCVDLRGIQRSRGGSAAENTRTAFAVLAGDATGDQRINNTDVGAVLSKQSVVIGPESALNDLRADLNADGVVDSADVAIATAGRGIDFRPTPDACPAQTSGGVAGVVPLPLGAERGLPAGSHPVPGAAPSWLGAGAVRAIPSAASALAEKRAARGGEGADRAAAQLPGGWVVNAWNTLGDLAGYVPGVPGAERGFRFSPDGSGLVDLGTLGGTMSTGQDVNDRAEVAGGSTTGDGVERPVLYADLSGLVALGPPARLVGRAYGLDERGWAAGMTLDAAGGQRATLWPGAYGGFDVNSLLPAGSGWVLLAARGFDADGRLVGHGVYLGAAADFSLELTVDASLLADFNNDGALNLDDLGDYITAFYAGGGEGRLDVNLNRVVNLDDLGDYITAFYAR